jgi:hypothetical protein
MVLIANYQAPEVLKPGEQALYLPASLVTTKLAAVLSAWPTSLLAVRSNQINATLLQKALIKPITVVSLIANEAIRSMWGKAVVKGRLHQLYFMGLSAFNVSGDRKTSSVCDGHDLGPLPRLVLPTAGPPFLPEQMCRR